MNKGFEGEADQRQVPSNLDSDVGVQRRVELVAQVDNLRMVLASERKMWVTLPAFGVLGCGVMAIMGWDWVLLIDGVLILAFSLGLGRLLGRRAEGKIEALERQLEEASGNGS